MNLQGFANHNLDEVVFEHRNKVYGAYALRKSYSSHLLKASVYAILFFLLLYFVSWLTSLFKPHVLTLDVVKTTPFEPMKGVELIIEPQTAPAPPKTSLRAVTHSNNGQITIVRDRDVPTTTSAQQTNPVTNANQNLPGGTGSTDVPTNGTGTVRQGTTGIPIENENTIQTFVEQMPTFPGGAEALLAFLSNELQYPQLARQFSVEGKVLVSFIVEPDGSITNIQIERSRGYGLDEEAARVVSLMSKWNPGVQNGKKVRVKFVLPIQFKLD